MTSLALGDSDKFKSINDTYGHDVGDNVLREVGHLLRTSARKRDIVGRLGGEEFAVLLPDTDAREAYECAERLRAAIENGTPVTLDAVGPVTASRSEEHTSELQSLMRISYAVFCLKKKKQI